ncbi:MAG: carbon monoxide dehydrogenase subunit G [Candidatus Solibacter usitatus]|nr:carbon monoxide dehydrogenase subunit G [Candidatus Solibacter usitatus]
MKVTGSHLVPLDRARVYSMLQDPEVLAACMPGCEKLEKSGEDSYTMKMKMALAAISGQFDGKVSITDQNPPGSFRLLVEGTSKIGFMKGGGLLTLTTEGDATCVAYEGDVQVGGTLAAVGQRLIDATSKMMIKRFFEKLIAVQP